MGERLLGVVQALQIVPVKIITQAGYDPGPVRRVDKLRVEEGGALGWLDGEWVMDLHHAAHPSSHNRARKNDLLITFTSLTAQTRAVFGPHLSPGSAGEQIIIETEQPYQLSDLGRALLLRSTAGQEIARLERLSVAEPCLDFCQYALGRAVSGEQAKAALLQLGEGRRGFYACVPAGQPASEVLVGQRLFALD